MVGGRILFQGRDLLGYSPRELQAVRGNRIAMIFQDPMMTLNPVLRIETQMVETIQAHRSISHGEARSRARDVLGMVGIASPDERLAAYPHEFSGGMRQRVAIAIALLNEPDLIIADEPTTALDVTIQAQIIAQIREISKRMGLALIWISHDLGVVANLADRIAVMYAGRIIEAGPAEAVLEQPAHPYTAGLIASIPGDTPRGQRLHQIPGNTPPPLQRPSGCAFRPRCAHADALCEAEPAVRQLAGRDLRCFHPLIAGAL